MATHFLLSCLNTSNPISLSKNKSNLKKHVGWHHFCNCIIKYLTTGSIHFTYSNVTFHLQQTVHQQPFYHGVILQHSKKLQVIKLHYRHTTSYIKKIHTNNSIGTFSFPGVLLSTFSFSISPIVFSSLCTVSFKDLTLLTVDSKVSFYDETIVKRLSNFC